MTFSGTGSTILNNSGNTYSNGTVINGGTVFANATSGSSTGTNAIIVQSGATLAGN